ncbi:putative B3 domain-containing protein At3g24850 [Salvia hispanica]|uniref:putative B3 domain-containing protein At3g24850 n=1 Tax=Salvia hispanica TaxID=49212 RepID=UPI00200975AC|nr:putative B3 domain-containing protein At3g24850 [Salvia hispanica]
MDPTDLSLSDFQSHELRRITDPGAILLTVVARATEIAVANEPARGSSGWRRRTIRPFSIRRRIAPPEPVRGANPAKRRKLLGRGLSPAEGLTSMIRQLSRRRDVSPPPLPKLVIQKPLCRTDVSSHHNRLSIPISQTDDGFLTEAEKQRLRSGNKRSNHMNVKIMAAAAAGELSTETVKLSRWDMRKGEGRKTSSIYAINGKWNAFVKKYNLTEGMVVQLWFFRLREELCFALVQLPDSSA